ncbi:MAG: Nramp family divalent metal transporter [Chloroflexi bacterium]|nr:Nramp family divalent metal transporter [Chloroflexota bacterium]
MTDAAIVRPRTIRPGLRINVRGRSVKLRGLRRAPVGLLRWLAILGPGVIASVAGDDAGGVGTTSVIGARLGYELLWLLLLLTVSLAVVQEMAARMGTATGRGLLDLVRERFGIGWALLAVVAILIGNGGVVATEFAGIAVAAELLGLSRYVAVPASALAVWLLVLFGSYRQAERLFLVMTLAFLAYPAAALLAQPDWGAVAHGALVPSLHGDTAYLLLVVALVGTTITPYQQLFQQSAVVEKGVAQKHYGAEGIDAYAGAVLGNVIWACVIIATAATLHAHGVSDIQSATDAAEALRPIAGDSAERLFAIGLLGASLLAAGVVPLATAYSVSEAFGFRKGVGLDFRRAPVFYGLFSALIVIGAAVALWPAIPLIGLLVGIQILNGVLLPIVLGFILLLASDRRLMGNLRNTKMQAVLGWTTLVLVSAAVLVLLLNQVVA